MAQLGERIEPVVVTTADRDNAPTVAAASH
jgi:hypothetical protein